MSTVRRIELEAKEKLWGETRCVFRDDTHEVWHASPKKGGYSSVHHHTHRHNEFYVVAGELWVKVFRDLRDDIPDHAVLLRPGEKCVVPAGLYHQFLAATDAELIETYYHRLGDDDITRHTEGGLTP